MLAGLVDRSLVLAEEREGQERYRCLSTLREYAQEHLRNSGEQATVQRRHAEYFLNFVEEAEPQLTGPEERTWLERLETEHDNLRSILGWAVAGDVAIGLRVAEALQKFWRIRGYSSEGRRWLDEMLDQERTSVDVVRRAKALSAAGALAIDDGDYRAAAGRCEEALMLFRTLAHTDGTATVLMYLGHVATRRGDLSLAYRRYEESLTLYRELRDVHGIAMALTSIGNVAERQGHYALARTQYLDSLPLWRQLSDKWNIAAILNNLGVLAEREGTYYEDSLTSWRELGDRRQIALALNNLGGLAEQRADYVQARTLCEEGLTIRRELGDKHGIAMSLKGLGNIAARQRNFGEAEALYRQSITLRRELGESADTAVSLESLASIAVANRQLDRAVRLWAAADALRKHTSSERPENELEEYERNLHAVRIALGESTFVALWDEGRRMAPEEAVAYALEDQQRVIGAEPRSGI